ncbi:MAG: N-6 DNA methylase [Planctomycetaceae bacterium]|nr:N-6 DNA methylase [Planctomycetaceae bacterium]
MIEEITIGQKSDNKIIPSNDNFDKFAELIRQFSAYHTENIKTSAELSKQMAAKARLLAEIIETSLNKDIENKEETELNNQYEGFKSILIDTISTKDFADLYAQTIAYGMFAARMNDGKTDDFTREKAAKSIPQTNPFLRKMFGFIAGVDLDGRISWIVDALADLFNRVDINTIRKEIGRYADNDPVIHFYETFLTDYDKKLKKQRGVWYTPQPVVRFIVRAVNEILKNDFGIAAGLAENSKVTVGDNEYHKVQILDPATGTGTFLAEVIEQIYKNFENQQGMWNDYVNEHLIPRINGFEILMASYAMTHLKLEMLLQETHAEITNNQRLKVYLTDSLEPAPDKGEKKLSFAKWLTDEANEAAQIKRNTPVMVILGNPPYSGESINKGNWILNLLDDYKKEPSGGRLQEKNSKWLNDDYVKFIRLGQYFIEKNGYGILAYINNHSFLDNPTFRGMRNNLLKTFDKIYILDMHGNAKKKETAPDGNKDENVFDIQQGVSINIFVKMPVADTQATQIFHFDLYGKREEKYAFLNDNTLSSINWTELQPADPDYFFVLKDFSLQAEYGKGFSIVEMFPVNSVGVVTARDNFTIHDTKQNVKDTITEFLKLDTETARKKFNLGKDTRDWSVDNAKKDLTSNPDFDRIVKINYRPFDIRYTYYTGHSKGFHCMPRGNVMQHFLKGENVGLIIGRQGQAVGSMTWNLVFITSHIEDLNLYYRGGGLVFPLYLYQNNFDQTEKVANMNAANLTAFESLIGFVPAPEQIFDYIYAVLHSPAYRERYKEFLKIDFPRVPYPANAEQFNRLVGFGERLRKLHLMENIEPKVNLANFPVQGTNEIEKPEYVDNKVFINSIQSFDNVPKSAWEFYIGGYQPTQKWLKDRKGRKLGFNDVRHYQRIIAVLVETEKIMREIDEIII